VYTRATRIVGSNPTLSARLRNPRPGLRDSAVLDEAFPRTGMTTIKLPEILFLCTGNSCRSILAESILNGLAQGRLHAASAGSRPAGTVHPRTLALLRREGFATEGLKSKSWDEVIASPDIVITVCAGAAGETCPAYLGPALRAHWGLDDPARVAGTESEIDAAFDKAYRILRRRIEALLDLPVARWLSEDRPRLGRELEGIGNLES